MLIQCDSYTFIFFIFFCMVYLFISAALRASLQYIYIFEQFLLLLVKLKTNFFLLFTDVTAKTLFMVQQLFITFLPSYNNIIFNQQILQKLQTVHSETKERLVRRNVKLFLKKTLQTSLTTYGQYEKCTIKSQVVLFKCHLIYPIQSKLKFVFYVYSYLYTVAMYL